jgi:hypothetical protein
MPVKWNRMQPDAMATRHPVELAQTRAPTAHTPASARNSGGNESQLAGRPTEPSRAATAASPHDHHRSGRIDTAAPAVIAPATLRSSCTGPSTAGGGVVIAATTPSPAAAAPSPTAARAVARTNAGSWGGSAWAGVAGGEF